MLLQADASQLEWRTLVELAKDPIGMQEIINNDDIHTNNKVAFDLPSRLIAKIYLFRTIYRGEGWSFANDPDFMHVSKDADYWNEINVKFYKKYKGIDKTHSKWKDIVLSRQDIPGPFGRDWRVELGKDKYGGLKIPWTTLTNYPVNCSGLV